MGQSEFEHQPDAEVTFELKNRAPNLLSEFVDPIELNAVISPLSAPDDALVTAGINTSSNELPKSYLIILLVPLIFTLHIP